MHAVLFAKVTSWPAWMQLLHPLATVIAKSKLLVLPVYPAAWPQAKKHPFVQVVFRSYKAIKSLYPLKKVGFRYASSDRWHRGGRQESIAHRSMPCVRGVASMRSRSTKV